MRIFQERGNRMYCYGETGVDWSEKSTVWWVCKRKVREEIWGKTNNTKGHLRNYMETYCRNFLKYILIYERNLNGVTNL